MLKTRKIFPITSITRSMEHQLIEAVKNNNLDEVKRLLSAGVDKNFIAEKGLSALHYAATLGNIDVMIELIKAQADINTRNSIGSTPLISAVVYQLSNVVLTLVKANADINIKNNDGATALFWAASNGNIDITRILIEGCADVNAKDSRGLTPLHIAAANGKSEIVNLLIEARAIVNFQTNSGATPLHSAVESGHKESLNIIQMLLNANAFVNKRDNLGATPLHYAVQWGLKDIVITLINGFADYTIKDHDDNSAEDIAIKNEMFEIIDIFDHTRNLHQKSISIVLPQMEPFEKPRDPLQDEIDALKRLVEQKNQIIEDNELEKIREISDYQHQLDISKAQVASLNTELGEAKDIDRQIMLLHSIEDCNNYETKLLESLKQVQYRRSRLSEESKNSSRCTVCMEATKIVVLIPCGHLVYCEDCSFHCRERRECPICMQVSESRVKIYH